MMGTMVAAGTRTSPAPALVLGPLAAVVPVVFWFGVRAVELYTTASYTQPLLGRQLIALPLLAVMVMSIAILSGYLALLPLFLTRFMSLAARGVYQALLFVLAAAAQLFFFVAFWVLLGGVWDQALTYGMPVAICVGGWNLLWWVSHPRLGS